MQGEHAQARGAGASYVPHEGHGFRGQQIDWAKSQKNYIETCKSMQE